MVDTEENPRRRAQMRPVVLVGCLVAQCLHDRVEPFLTPQEMLSAITGHSYVLYVQKNDWDNMGLLLGRMSASAARIHCADLWRGQSGAESMALCLPRELASILQHTLLHSASSL